MTLPNLVIAGAPKCGTTSLFAWLSDHPEVCGASRKETNFLVDPGAPLFDDAANYRDHGLAGYSQYFAHCDRERHRIVVEATPDYLYYETALEVLAGLDPQPQVTFIFRKPSERVYSFYQFARNNMAMVDPEVTFRRYVSMIRSGDSYLSERGSTGNTLSYSRYVDYLERWIERFPRSHLHFLLFEDLQRDPRGFMRAVATRLGIDPGFYDSYDFSRKKFTYRVRSHRLHRLRLAVGRRIPSSRPKELLRRGLRRAYAALNIEPAGLQRTDDDRRLLAELDREFGADNARLSAVTGLDLRAWS